LSDDAGVSGTVWHPFIINMMTAKPEIASEFNTEKKTFDFITIGMVKL
jgi:hypothetical protein